jgi:hypothetical protein
VKLSSLSTWQDHASKEAACIHNMFVENLWKFLEWQAMLWRQQLQMVEVHIKHTWYGHCLSPSYCTTLPNTITSSLDWDLLYKILISIFAQASTSIVNTTFKKSPTNYIDKLFNCLMKSPHRSKCNTLSLYLHARHIGA